MDHHSVRQDKLRSRAVGGGSVGGYGVVRGVPYSPTDLAPRVFDCNRDTYGQRNKIDWSPGSVVMTLHGNYWQIRMPMIMGVTQFFVSKNFEEGDQGNYTGRHAARGNVLRAVVDLTQSLATSLSDNDLAYIEKVFHNGYATIQFLQELQGHDLFDHARGDYRQSVEVLRDGRTLSKARWDNAQCAEKIFKGLLARAGHPYPTNAKQGHDIAFLGGLLKQHLGIDLPERSLQTITCPPAVRYADINVDANEAWTSHHELLATLLPLGAALKLLKK